jgi:hypothetical protein
MTMIFKNTHMIKRSNLRIHGIVEGAKAQIKVTENLFKEITPKISQI